MASNARKAFDNNADDIERLLEIHRDLGGEQQGRRHRLGVLNKSAIVLITAIWEAYCEDIAAEALNHIVNSVADASKLPVDLKRRIAKELKADLNDIAIWCLADGGWKVKVKARLAAMTVERNRNLNTPKSGKIDQLFADAIGLAKVSDAWTWTRVTADKARAKLDQYVTLRGAIAHRGTAASSCNKTHVEDYFELIKKLVSKTGGRVNAFVRPIAGSGLW